MRVVEDVDDLGEACGVGRIDDGLTETQQLVVGGIDLLLERLEELSNLAPNIVSEFLHVSVLIEGPNELTISTPQSPVGVFDVISTSIWCESQSITFGQTVGRLWKPARVGVRLRLLT